MTDNTNLFIYGGVAIVAICLLKPSFNPMNYEECVKSPMKQKCFAPLVADLEKKGVCKGTGGFDCRKLQLYKRYATNTGYKEYLSQFNSNEVTINQDKKPEVIASRSTKF